MTIGPAPMIRIEEMSVRLGMSLGDIRAQKKGALFARPSAAQRVRPRARALFRPESAGREGRPQNNGVKRAGGTTRVTHARRAMKVMRAPLWPILGGGGGAREAPGRGRGRRV